MSNSFIRLTSSCTIQPNPNGKGLELRSKSLPITPERKRLAQIILGFPQTPSLSKNSGSSPSSSPKRAIDKTYQQLVKKQKSSHYGWVKYMCNYKRDREKLLQRSITTICEESSQEVRDDDIPDHPPVLCRTYALGERAMKEWIAAQQKRVE